jgi:hypothetical protein
MLRLTSDGPSSKGILYESILYESILYESILEQNPPATRMPQPANQGG